MRGKLIAVSIVALVLAATAYAHHSFPATYQINKLITIEGKVAQLLFRNPHSFLQVDAPDANGEMKRWSLEWGGAGQLTSQGVVKDTLKSGDVIIVTANPARSTADSTRALLKTIKRPSDGWAWGNAAGQVVE
jgi:Family of unknown function (DUF6152)